MDSYGGHHHLDNIEPLQLPPGFRFHPTDEELITCYLLKKVVGACSSGRAITEIDLNKCEPWELPEMAKMGEEWYFFSLRDRKYPTGLRTNRATGAGYWKATGKDKEVHGARSGALVGMKKTLVFYTGRAPKGAKSNWVMHEYRLEGTFAHHLLSRSSKDEWVLARVFHKSSGGCKKTRHLCPSVPSASPVAFSVESKAAQTGVCGSPPSASVSNVLDSSEAPFAVVTGSQAAETVPDSVLFFRQRSAERDLVPCFSTAANHASRPELPPACDGSGSGFPFLRPLLQESVHVPYSLTGIYQVPTPLRAAPTVDGVLLSSGELRGRRVGDAWPWGDEDSKAYGEFKQHVGSGSSELDCLWTV